MGGDIILKESCQGLTIFGFKIPVLIKEGYNMKVIDEELMNEQMLNILAGE